MKYKVGDRVKVRSGYFRYGHTGTVIDNSGLSFVAVKLDCGLSVWAPDGALDPLSYIPEGWTPSSEPPKARYIVSADLPTHITVWHDTLDDALTEAQRLCVKQGKAFHVLKVVAEVNPGKPEVIRMEDDGQ